MGDGRDQTAENSYTLGQPGRLVAVLEACMAERLRPDRSGWSAARHPGWDPQRHFGGRAPWDAIERALRTLARRGRLRLKVDEDGVLRYRPALLRPPGTPPGLSPTGQVEASGGGHRPVDQQLHRVAAGVVGAHRARGAAGSTATIRAVAGAAGTNPSTADAPGSPAATRERRACRISRARGAPASSIQRRRTPPATGPRRGSGGGTRTPDTRIRIPRFPLTR
jgi:hypothetical protein